jgi:zinc transporter 2
MESNISEHSGVRGSDVEHGHGHSHEHGHGHSHDTPKEAKVSKASTENINVRAALIHVIGDFCQSCGVFVAALIIYFVGVSYWRTAKDGFVFVYCTSMNILCVFLQDSAKIADPICTFIFSILVLFTTITILRDVIAVLMEGKINIFSLLHYNYLKSIQITGTPRGVKFADVFRCLEKVRGVKKVHNLRIWALTLDKVE